MRRTAGRPVEVSAARPSGVSADLDPGTALFVGGFVAAVCWFAAALTWVAGGGVPAVSGIAVALAGLGVAFLALGGAIAVAVRLGGGGR